ncbi:CHC2-type zinc finger protein [Gemmobacter caeni]|uniref:CHC2-type zinc finger protein n=1 Tax=Gemmobacter caeni TaxID=589035 RepID=A0A2T6B8W0_9RHOB|nr:CHC2 zinc finger domain-containing protein [Gemmobacter caeni]PTX52499.1 CHC2-type zinc finger protein [Gemmobacter caeni]TWJ02830.1 CHC2-type zinc finger protein [Gemmobacter caeni]
MPSPAKKSPDQLVSYRDQLRAFKDQVRDMLPIDRAIEEMAGVSFTKRAGSVARMACCPFHNERSPSFSVNPQAGYYRCFGSGCGAHGDLFSFIMDFFNVPFMEALAMAGRQVGMEMPEPDGKAPRKGTKPAPSIRPRPRISDRSTHPADLKDHGLLPVPERARRPRPNLVAKGWHEGNSETPAGPRFYRPKMVHEYRNASGQLLLSILRLEFMKKEDGQEKRVKMFMPFRLAELPEAAPRELMIDPERRMGWLVRSVAVGSRRPVYGMECLTGWTGAGGRDILIVEGEKTADAARRLLRSAPDADRWIVLSPLGGGSSALHADWTELATAIAGIEGPVRVRVWPDADTPISRPDGEVIDRQKKYGREIVNGLGYALMRAGADPSRISFARITPIEGVKHGWDLADAEAEGWSADRVFAKIQDEGIPLTPEPQYLETDRPVREEADEPVPFDHDETAVQVRIWDDLMRENERGEMGEMSQDATAESRVNEDPLDLLPVTETSPAPLVLDAEDPLPARAPDAPHPVTDLTEEEVVLPDEGGNDDLVRDPQVEMVMENPFFRCLGYESGVSYFMSMLSGQVFDLNPSTMRPNFLIHLAPSEWWVRHFPTAADRNGIIKTDWESAVNALVKTTYRVGQYKAENQAGQGAWTDGNRIVFNNGRGLWVEGDGPVSIRAFRGQKNYISGRFCGMPDFDNPLPADSPEAWALLELIENLNWAPETRAVSILNLFGWLAIGPLCGILPWRPHLWLSGERGVGKSWIINNIINRIFCEYGVNVKADSTESGLRNLLNMHAFPLIFDEAEGETMEDRNRMTRIIRLARHSADPGKSVVAQGVPGGKGQRQYAIASTFLMCSITPQLTQAADNTRFGRAHLLQGLNHYDFVERLQEPAERLLTEDFSRRFMARMIMSGRRMLDTCQIMFNALSGYGLERRLIDVYGTYLAGAWVLLRDGLPENEAAAISWARETFNMLDGLVAQASEVSEDKDHVRLFQHLFTTDIKVETVSFGTRTFSLIELIEIALGTYPYEDTIAAEEAVRSLHRIGIRLGISQDRVIAAIPPDEWARMPHKERAKVFGRAAQPGERPDCLLIHKKSTHIEKYLEKTPYAGNYADVMVQAKGVRKGGSIRFPGGTYRSVEVPLEILSLGGDVTNGGDEQVRGE